MKILFQGPLLSPTWKGYIANRLLTSLKEFDVSTLHVPDERELVHPIGASYERQLDKTLISVNSSLITTLQTFDVQIVVSDWKDAWNLLLPKMVNIVIGLDNNPPASYMLANCYKKLHHTEVKLDSKVSTFPESSQFKELKIHEQPFKFIYPSTMRSLDKEDLVPWIGDPKELEGKRLVIYYPEPYCQPQTLANNLVSLGLEDLDIDIIASPEEIDSITALIEHPNCVDQYLGYDSNKIHKIYPESFDSQSLSDLIKELSYEN